MKLTALLLIWMALAMLLASCGSETRTEIKEVPVEVIVEKEVVKEVEVEVIVEKVVVKEVEVEVPVEVIVEKEVVKEVEVEVIVEKVVVKEVEVEVPVEVIVEKEVVKEVEVEVIVEKVVVKEVEVEVIVTATPTPTPTPTATPTAITTPDELVRRVQHGIVRVTAGFSSAGSGFIFEVRETTAFVATNHHVIERERTVDVQVHTGHTYKALVLGWDSDLDVAVLAICCSREFTALRWDPAEREVGTQVIAVGFPRSTEGGLTATTGETVAHDAISRQHGFIPHSAPLNPGNSGGPLFAMPNATVLGINTAGGLQELRFYAVPYQAVEESMEDWRAQLVVAPAPTPIPKRSFPTVEAGLSAYTVNDIRDPAPLGQYYDLEIGKRVVALDITQEATLGEADYNEWSFSIQDSEGYVYDRDGRTSLEPNFGFGGLAKGQRVRGWIPFLVPDSAVLVSVLVESGILMPKVVIADLTEPSP